MPAAFSIRVLDSIIRIEVDGTLSVDEIAGLERPWHALRVHDDEPVDATVRVVVGHSTDAFTSDATVLAGAEDVHHAAPSLATAVTLQGIAKLRGRAVLLHAAGVALDDGRVIGFVGPSGRGKTTAARELARCYGYVTDETLAILPDLSVIPYPKPLSVLDGPPPKHSIAPKALGMRALPATPLTLAAIALLERRPDAGGAWVEHVDLAEAIGMMAPDTSSLVALPRPLGDLVDTVQRTGGVRRVVYAEASQLAELVPAILAGSVPPEDEVQMFAGKTDDGAVGAGGRSLYRRVPWSDAVQVADRLIVHNGSRVFVLDGLGPALWQAADGRDLDDLTAAVTREVPPPADVDVRRMIADRLDDLMAAGVLFRR